MLARLAALLDPYDPADRTVRATAYDVLTRRCPEDVPYLTGLAETYQVDEPSDTLADVYERLAALQLDDNTYRMHLAETLLGLGRAAEARAVLACVREHGGADEGRLLGLEGRTALALAEPERAMTLLRAALDKNPKATPADVEVGLSGNICRCGTYEQMRHAIASLCGQGKEGG